MESVYNFLKKTVCLKANDRVVVGVSAGPDSMALLYILKELQKDIGYKIIVAHVNHNVRKESVEEASFLEQYCMDNDLIFENMTIEKYGDDNFHNEARNIRYNFYRKLIDKYQGTYLMTGHHGDDLIETILMRIVRGSTLKGYSGFNGYVDMGDYKIVRPLLHATKEQIEKFNKENNIPYRIDKSNFKSKYTRNRYRKQVLPFLKEEDSNVHEKFIKFSQTLVEYDNFTDKMMHMCLSDVYEDGVLNISKFLTLDLLLQKRIIDYLLANIYRDDLIQIDDRHQDLVLRAINSKKASLKYNLPNDYLIVKEYDKLYFKKIIDQIDSYDIELNDEVFLPNGMQIEKIDDTNSDGNDIMRLSSKDVVLPLRVRTRRNGDKMSIKNLDHVKKVSDIFINSKVPVDKRDLWPIVVDSTDKIVWIPKVKKSKYNRLKSEKCDIIFKCY